MFLSFVRLPFLPLLEASEVFLLPLASKLMPSIDLRAEEMLRLRTSQQEINENTYLKMKCLPLLFNVRVKFTSLLQLWNQRHFRSIDKNLDVDYVGMYNLATTNASSSIVSSISDAFFRSQLPQTKLQGQCYEVKWRSKSKSLSLEQLTSTAMGMH